MPIKSCLNVDHHNHLCLYSGFKCAWVNLFPVIFPPLIPKQNGNGDKWHRHYMLDVPPVTQPTEQNAEGNSKHSRENDPLASHIAFSHILTS